MSAPDTRMVVVAQFAGTHGVRGDFKIRSYTENPAALFGYGPLTTTDGTVLRPQKIRDMKPGIFLCRDSTLGSPEECAGFKGQLLHVPRDVLPQSNDGDDYYVQDLIGLEARTEDGTIVGRVRAVPNYGAGDIVEIQSKSGLVLVPFTKAAVPLVSLAEGTLTVVLASEPDADALRE